MNFFTSYYANYRNIPSTCMCIGISRSCPDGLKDGHPNFLWVSDSFLAPSESTLRRYKDGEITKEEYCREYVDRFENGVSRLGGFEGWLRKVSENFQTYDAVVFMCYERPEDFCHRKILAGMLRQLGVECTEIEVEPTAPKAPRMCSSVELF